MDENDVFGVYRYSLYHGPILIVTTRHQQDVLLPSYEHWDPERYLNLGRAGGSLRRHSAVIQSHEPHGKPDSIYNRMQRIGNIS
ncbi:hypothetical protein BJX63DRAFT_274360 [Aspergillus granulosus]|uniref:Uncharacterized protein n=1 Tax=Aspergillus granulosus TaxID=176169 RepID=A0ABR4H850_9EURO